MRALRFADLAVLALSLPVFLLAGLPVIGWAVGAAAWLAQRGIQVAATRRATASNEPRTIAGLLAGSMLVRGWLVALAVFGVGLAESDEAGLAAAVLVLAVFTVYLAARMALRPFEAGRGAP